MRLTSGVMHRRDTSTGTALHAALQGRQAFIISKTLRVISTGEEGGLHTVDGRSLERAVPAITANACEFQQIDQINKLLSRFVY